MIIDEKQKARIINYNKYIWENRLGEKDIEDWLNNFNGKVFSDIKEKEIAIDLLKNFLYYNENEIKYLCKTVFLIFKRKKIGEFLMNCSSLGEAEKLFKKYLEKCRFSHIGRPSESGCFMLYYFRQSNKLPISIFLDRWEDITQEIRSILFIDDFLGTGSTAVRFWNNPIVQNLVKEYPDIELYYLVIFALKNGIINVKTNTNFNIISSQIFNEEYRIFSNESYVFPKKEKRKIARCICEKYGKYLEGNKYALGYNDSEALLGFHHNIPNNTLPIIWSTKNEWHPLFKREGKRYRW
jgi:hypothetical protein